MGATPIRGLFKLNQKMETWCEVYYLDESVGGKTRSFYLIKGFEDGKISGEVKSYNLEYATNMLQDLKRTFSINENFVS